MRHMGRRFYTDWRRFREIPYSTYRSDWKCNSQINESETDRWLCG